MVEREGDAGELRPGHEEAVPNVFRQGVVGVEGEADAAGLEEDRILAQLTRDLGGRFTPQYPRRDLPRGHSAIVKIP